MDESDGVAAGIDDPNAALERSVMARARDLAAFRRQSAALEQECETLKRQNRALELAVWERDQLLEAMYRSTSWRVSAPLRAVARMLWGAGRAELRPSGQPGAPGPEAIARLKQGFRQSFEAALTAFLDSGETLVLPQHEAPTVSVVIPIWNQASLLLPCLQALAREPEVTLEIILVDNGSDSRTQALLGQLQGARLLRNERNEGYVRACNAGAALARGTFVLQLNSDAFVRPGALAAAVACATDGRVGAVGGKLVQVSGQLQEAGSVIWSDGWTLGYGRGWDPDRPEAQFRRAVDYVSGAFLLTPTTLWRALGGYDTLFAPAYYEDADYGMRVREGGYAVIYEPGAVVDHFELGSEAASGDALRASVLNRDAFVARHRARLATDHMPQHPERLLFARSRPSAGRLLVVDNEVPIAALGSGYPRLAALLRVAVAEGWSVTLYTLHQREIDWVAAYAAIPREVEVIPGGDQDLAGFLRSRRGFFGGVMVSRPENMTLFRRALAKDPGAPDGAALIYDAEALSARREIERRRVAGPKMPAAEAARLIGQEVALAQGSALILCVNEAEAAEYRSRQTAPVRILSHAVAVRQDAPGFDGRRGFLFVGRLLEREAPNWQGLSWFVRECWELIRAALPDAVLTVVGRHHSEVASLQRPGIRFLGGQAELVPHYDSARVFLAPVRFAAGIPLKVIEAAANGLPAAGTRLMASQLDWTPSVEICAEDGPAELATAAVRLHEDRALWEAIRRAAMQSVADAYGEKRFAESVRAMLSVADPAQAAPAGRNQAEAASGATATASGRNASASTVSQP